MHDVTPDLGVYLTATTGPGAAQDGIAGVAASDTASAAGTVTRQFRHGPHLASVIVLGNYRSDLAPREQK